MNKTRKSSEKIIIGRNPVLEALRAGTKIEKIFILHGVHGNAIKNITTLARQKGVTCVDVGKNKFDEFDGSSDAQGVIAIVGQKDYVEVEDILDFAVKKNEVPFILILDEIEDPQNLGAIIRTAECVGTHGVIIPKHHAASVSSGVIKASAGAAQYVNVAKVTNIAQTIDELKLKGVWIIGTDGTAEKFYYEMDYKMPLALVIGSEGYGIRRLVKEKCDFLVKIPMFGKIESLNASVAAALVMYEVVRKRK
jgi:23S rRNA (guanosine2251-2'-O)-methyltransferase